MAQKWRMARRNTPAGQRKARPPLDEAALRALALGYLARYATSRHKLAAYLARKLEEAGWDGTTAPDIPALVAHYVDLGYLDDAAYAQSKGASLLRRGYGPRRVRDVLSRDGLEAGDLDSAADTARAGEYAAAERLARRARIGPFAASIPDMPTRQKQLARFLRAGHSMDMARRWVHAAPGEVPEDET